jgi:hypothetical protein
MFCSYASHPRWLSLLRLIINVDLATILFMIKMIKNLLCFHSNNLQGTFIGNHYKEGKKLVLFCVIWSFCT